MVDVIQAEAPGAAPRQNGSTAALRGQTHAPRAARLDLVLASLFLGVLGLAVPLMVLYAVDGVLAGSVTDADEVLLLAGVAAGAVFLEAVFHGGRGVIAGWLEARARHAATCAGFQALLGGERDTGIQRPLGIAGGASPLLLKWDVGFGAVALISAAYIGGPLAAIPTVLAVLGLIAAIRLAAEGTAPLHDKAFAGELRRRSTGRLLLARPEIKALGAERMVLRQREALAKNDETAERRLARLEGWASGIAAALTPAALIITLAVGAVFAIEGQFSLGGLAATALLAARATTPVATLVAEWRLIARGSREEGAPTRSEPGASEPSAAERGLPDLPAVDGRMTLEGLTVRAPGTGPAGGGGDPEAAKGRAAPDKGCQAAGPSNFLENVNLTIEPGRFISIVGLGGTGKSTLLRCLAGLMRPAAGRVLIDGQDIRAFNRVSYRRKVAYVTATEAMFAGTVMDNLTMFRPDLADAARDAVKLLGFEDTIDRLPKGYDTVLSGAEARDFPAEGQQLVGLARALVDRPKVILFDGADHALGRPKLAALGRLLAALKGGVTVVMVTDVGGLNRLADEIYRLDGGLRRIDKGARI